MAHRVRAIPLTAAGGLPTPMTVGTAVAHFSGAGRRQQSAALTAGERAVGQRTEYRSQNLGVLDRQVILVKVHQGVAHDDRAALGGAEQCGDVRVFSAAGFGGDGLSRDAG